MIGFVPTRLRAGEGGRAFGEAVLRGAGCVQPSAVLVGWVRSFGFRGYGLGEHPPLTAPFLFVQQDAPHRTGGARQPRSLVVPLCCFLPLEQAALPRVELPSGHPAPWGHRHLPVRVHRPLGRPLASEPRRCVWGLTLTCPHVIPRVGSRLLLLSVLLCVFWGHGRAPSSSMLLPQHLLPRVVVLLGHLLRVLRLNFIAVRCGNVENRLDAVCIWKGIISAGTRAWASVCAFLSLNL